MKSTFGDNHAQEPRTSREPYKKQLNIDQLFSKLEEKPISGGILVNVNRDGEPRLIYADEHLQLMQAVGDILQPDVHGDQIRALTPDIQVHWTLDEFRGQRYLRKSVLRPLFLEDEDNITGEYKFLVEVIISAFPFDEFDTIGHSLRHDINNAYSLAWSYLHILIDDLSVLQDIHLLVELLQTDMPSDELVQKVAQVIKADEKDGKVFSDRVKEKARRRLDFIEGYEIEDSEIQSIIDALNSILTLNDTIIASYNELSKLSFIGHEVNTTDINLDYKQHLLETMSAALESLSAEIGKMHSALSNSPIIMNKSFDTITVEILSALDNTQEVISLTKQNYEEVLSESGSTVTIGRFVDSIRTFWRRQSSIDGSGRIADNRLNMFYARDVLEAEIPSSMTLVVMELCLNGIKYAKIDRLEEEFADRSMEISISYCDGCLCIDVYDNGDGIPEEELSHVFEREWRSQKVSHIRGTGNGLANIKERIEQLGGEIHCESVVGQGTLFRIKLPHSSQEA